MSSGLVYIPRLSVEMVGGELNLLYNKVGIRWMLNISIKGTVHIFFCNLNTDFNPEKAFKFWIYLYIRRWSVPFNKFLFISDYLLLIHQCIDTTKKSSIHETTDQSINSALLEIFVDLKWILKKSGLTLKNAVIYVIRKFYEPKLFHIHPLYSSNLSRIGKRCCVLWVPRRSAVSFPAPNQRKASHT